MFGCCCSLLLAVAKLDRGIQVDCRHRWVSPSNPKRDVLPPLDEWLMPAFAPHRPTESIETMYDAQPGDLGRARASAAGVIAD